MLYHLDCLHCNGPKYCADLPALQLDAGLEDFVTKQAEKRQQDEFREGGFESHDPSIETRTLPH